MSILEKILEILGFDVEEEPEKELVRVPVNRDLRDF